MLMVPNKGAIHRRTNITGSAATSSFGTNVTTGGSVSTKGSAAELITSTPFDSYWITIIASGYASAAGASDGCFDLMVGAATEEVLIPNLLMGECGGDPNVGTGGTGPKIWNFPLYIPAGTRISAKAAGRRTSTTFQVGVILLGQNGYPPYPVGTKVTTYGMSTVPSGTTITPGASGANGSITQVTAATTEDHFAFFPSFQITNDATMTAGNIFVGMYKGASPSESLIGLGNTNTSNMPYIYGVGSSETMSGPYNPMPSFDTVPSGTRLSLRASCTSALDAGYNGVIHAVS